MDRFSPVAPAHIRVLVLPVGEIERSQYVSFLERLKNEASIITLAEIEPYVSDDELLLSPKAFRRGSMLYNYTASNPSEQHEQLSPYELFREPLLVLGVKDGAGGGGQNAEEELARAAEYLRERHPRVVHRQLLVLSHGEDGHSHAGETLHVQNSAQPDDISLRETICQTSARFLAELSTYTRAMQASPGVQTPGQTARGLQRTTSLREREKTPTSGHNTPPSRSGVSSPVDENGPKPPPLDRNSPATSFDQIAISHGPTSTSVRPDSRSSNKSKHGARASSQDRVSVQGFGSNTSQEKLKNRGRARVGIVIGSIYLLAGQWSEALRILVEHTNKARILADHLWHAKGLENITVCMLLHIWAGLDFDIPGICQPTAEHTTSMHVNRYSVNLPIRNSLSDEAQRTPIKRLSTYLPDLLKFTLSLYHSGEGSLELPSLQISETMVRFCKLMTLLLRSNGELSEEVLKSIIDRSPSKRLQGRLRNNTNGPKNLSKATIADMLAHAHPTADENTLTSDQIAILAGIASIYAMLGMDRKKGSTTRDLVNRLTRALNKARKRGAADVGIHPATSLSMEGGAEAILATAEGNGGLEDLISDLTSIYGMPLLGSSASDSTDNISTSFGSDNLKMGVVRELSAFCEASPDPNGVLRLNSSLLRFFGPNAAVDGEPDSSLTKLSKEDQVRLTTTMHRTISVSRHLGLPKVDATYWDSSLVRGVEFSTPEPGRMVVDRSKLKAGIATIEQTPGNPLLYDPNSSRPNTARETQQTYTLVENEVSQCIVTLQNPYDISIEVESLGLITEGVELKANHQPITISPMRLQRVLLSVSHDATGDSKITGCRIKLKDCAHQDFPIISEPWSPSAQTLIKNLGQDGRTGPTEDATPEHAIISAAVIEAQPTLVLNDSSLFESSMMLLDGEQRQLVLTLRNTSNVTASIFDVATTSDNLRLERTGESDSFEPKELAPTQVVSFTFQLTGRPGSSAIQAAFYYSCVSSETSYARILSVPINVTVNAALQIKNFDVLPLDTNDGGGDACIISFDIGNAWPKALSYNCSTTNHAIKSTSLSNIGSEEGTLAPGEIQRIFMQLSTLSNAEQDIEALRNALLERLQITWSCEGRKGISDLSGITLRHEAAEILRGSNLRLSFDIEPSEEPAMSFNVQPRLSAKAGSFATVQVMLGNRAAATSPPLLVQLRSHTSYGDYTHDERSIAIAGGMHRVVPPISNHDKRLVDFAICPLLGGIFQMEATVRPALEINNVESRVWCTTKSMELIVRL